ncbi:ATP-binding protein [Streptomyces lichenis]|uniref:ATP-binding protein n=1 Tax=Streptomyces lichenis TaxID=2306967 RepID=A0ABT0I7V5_9ACTN|nr:ATP-binding protein [Streptomyces lichenis]MCK8677408.1 ATP-binding protein [Streptomyces lichenis]
MSLSRQRRFARSRRSVGEARVFAATVLGEWGYPDQEYEVRLCVSELTTNALLHGVPPGREMSVVLALDNGLLRVEVRDSGDGEPEVRRLTADECTGRGLWVVREIADDFGVIDHVVGKTVWAEFKLPTIRLDGASSSG